MPRARLTRPAVAAFVARLRDLACRAMLERLGFRVLPADDSAPAAAACALPRGR